MNPQNIKRGILNFRFFGSLALSLIFIIGIAYFFYCLQPVSVSETEFQEFKIEKGEGIREIGARLSQRSLIKSVAVFKFYSLLTGKAHKFQTGVYDLKASMSTPQIVSILTSGKVKEVKIVIPEGLTVKDIDNLLAENRVINKGALIAFKPDSLSSDFSFLNGISSLEGFLFPDTYNFRINSSVEEVVEKFLINFKNKAWPLFQDTANWYDRLILASFLEREVPSFSDRQIVAGILLKRLETKMPLQVDATITYIKCDGKFKNCSDTSVYRRDLTISSVYNNQRLKLLFRLSKVLTGIIYQPLAPKKQFFQKLLTSIILTELNIYEKYSKTKKVLD
jgi:UPF0755 protein